MRWLDPHGLPIFILRRFRVPPGLHWRAAQLLNQHFLLGVAGVITDEQQRVLLFYHTYRRHMPWGFPGGWMMRGESPLETLDREVREESSLVVKAEELLLIGTTRERAKLEFVVRARFIEGSFRPSREVSAAQWWPLDQLPPLSAFQRTILSQLDARRPGEVGWYNAPWRAPHEEP